EGVGGGHALSATFCCCPRKFPQPPQYSDFPGETRPASRDPEGVGTRQAACLCVPCRTGSVRSEKRLVQVAIRSTWSPKVQEEAGRPVTMSITAPRACHHAPRLETHMDLPVRLGQT
ncbi:Hypothetical predicted protein, partial [Lynx pardinus]